MEFCALKQQAPSSQKMLFGASMKPYYNQDFNTHIHIESMCRPLGIGVLLLQSKVLLILSLIQVYRQDS